MRYWIEYIFFQIFSGIVRILPLKSAQRLGMYLGLTAYLCSPRRRAITLENLRHAFPEKSDEERKTIAKSSFQNYGIALIELLWFPNLDDGTIRMLVKPRNLDLLKKLYAEGKGLIVLSGHFGNWELVALGMAYLTQIPFTIIVQNQNNRLVNDVINRNRCLFGNRIVPMGISVREIIRTLGNNGIVAIAPDQSGDKDGGLYMEFFGRTTATHQGPAAFALRTGAPMLIGFMIRQHDGTYEVVVEEIETKDYNGYSEENVIALTQRHVRVLEDYIRKYPDHWMWMHRRWKHTK
jgi:Kdo2-lipid IVA lauroyltransferase/acyltransferase